jgi:ABC-type Fe3+-hydroxamate transport system substrate-binding protein
MLVALAALLLAACSRGGDVPDRSPSGSGGQPPPRLVSLSPAITRTLIDLGAGE